MVLGFLFWPSRATSEEIASKVPRRSASEGRDKRGCSRGRPARVRHFGWRFDKTGAMRSPAPGRLALPWAQGGQDVIEVIQSETRRMPVASKTDVANCGMRPLFLSAACMRRSITDLVGSPGKSRFEPVTP